MEAGLWAGHSDDALAGGIGFSLCSVYGRGVPLLPPLATLEAKHH